MDQLVRLGAAVQGHGSEADRLLLLHTAGDLLALIAALLIPIGLLYLIARRRDSPSRTLLAIIGLAFLAAAVHHAFALWGLLGADRWVFGTGRVLTAAVAFSAALVLWMHLPEAARQPTPHHLRRTNARLTRENWEQRQALHTAQEESQLLQEWFAHAPVGGALVSAAGRWLHVNERLAQALGLAHEEVLKHNPQILFAGLLDPAREPTFEERELTLLGETRHFRWRARALRGNAVRLVECQEITAERQLELMLVRAHGEFEAQAAAQAQALAEAKQQLERALAEQAQGATEITERAERLERTAAQMELLGARLSALAGIDATGLVSSHAFAVRLETAVAMAKRYGQGFAVVVIAANPIDDPQVSPAQVHATLGAVLQAELRETDVAARCDDERICALLAATTGADAARVAERIRRRLARTALAASDGRPLRLTCHTGAAEWKSGQGLGEVLGQAAAALRSARAGRRVHS